MTSKLLSVNVGNSPRDLARHLSTAGHGPCLESDFPSSPVEIMTSDSSSVLSYLMSFYNVRNESNRLNNCVRQDVSSVVLNDVAALYSQVYMPVTQVRNALTYLYGLVYSFKCAMTYHSNSRQSSSNSGRNSSNINNGNSHNQQKYHQPHLTASRQSMEFIVNHSADICTYLFTILRASLQQRSPSMTATSGTSASTGQSVLRVIGSIATLEQTIETLTGLVLIIRVFESDCSTSAADQMNAVVNAKIAVFDTLTHLCTLLCEELTGHQAAVAVTEGRHVSVLLRAAAVLTKDLFGFNDEPHKDKDTDTDAARQRLMCSMNELYIVLLTLPDSSVQMTPRLFKILIDDLRTHLSSFSSSSSSSSSYNINANTNIPDTATAIVTESNSVLSDLIINVCREQYSRFSDYNLSNRWCAVSSIVRLLPTATGIVSTAATTTTTTSDVLDIDLLLDQLDISSNTSVSSILICCKQAMSRLIDSNTTQQTTPNLSGRSLHDININNDDTNTTITALRDRVEGILSKCYRVAVQSTEQVEPTAVNAFIDLMLDDTLLLWAGTQLSQVLLCCAALLCAINASITKKNYDIV